ncbi:unnamed protein product [Gadus morhua 'NCC']
MTALQRGLPWSRGWGVRGGCVEGLEGEWGGVCVIQGITPGDLRYHAALTHRAIGESAFSIPRYFNLCSSRGPNTGAHTHTHTHTHTHIYIYTHTCTKRTHTHTHTH